MLKAERVKPGEGNTPFIQEMHLLGRSAERVSSLRLTAFT